MCLLPLRKLEGDGDGSDGGSAGVLLGSQHVLRPHPLVKLFLCQVAQLESSFLKGGAFLVGSLSDFCSLRKGVN